jgi:DNA-directed RNA polymerase specialized sigma24 family protein
MSSFDVPLWWDRGVDRAGRTIRPDVRKAAMSVWRSTCRRTQAVLSDPSQAAELMEGTVAQLSRYLDRKDIAVFSREIEGLVAHSFRRAVQREVVKRNRLVPLDGSGGLSNHVADETWRRQVQARLELQELVGFLADRSRSVLALRYAGYTWKETAQVMGESVAALRSAFWRDVGRVKRQLASRCDNKLELHDSL